MVEPLKTDPIAIITAITTLLQLLQSTGLLDQIVTWIKQLIALLTPAQVTQLNQAIAKLGLTAVLKAATA